MFRDIPGPKFTCSEKLLSGLFVYCTNLKTTIRSIMIIDLRMFEIAEKLSPGEDILKRCSNFSAIYDQAHT